MNAIASGNTSNNMRKKIGLFSCLLFGLAMLLPVAPVPTYGVIQPLSQGHMALAHLVAAVPMVFSAWSFGALGAEFPRAGSSYTFVSKSIHSYLGFAVGWTILLDYGLFPLLNYVVITIYICQLFPGLNYMAVIIISILLICIINLMGIKSVASVNNILTIFGFLVVFYFFFTAIRALSGGVGVGLSTLGFYNPATFDFSHVVTGASLACFSYLGFDTITTLAEDLKDPRRTLPRATILTCLIMTVVFVVMSWLAQNLYPSFDYTNPDAAFIDAAKAAGGAVMSNAIILAMIAGGFAFSLDMMAGVTRLLFGMGRDGVLPKRFFGYIDKRGVPVLNIIFITVFCLVFSTVKLGDLITLINFGGLFAFTCVNLSVIVHFFIKKKQRKGAGNVFKWLVFPALGFMTCFYLWISLPNKWLGICWLTVGVIYLIVYTRGFRRPMTAFDDEAAAEREAARREPADK